MLAVRYAYLRRLPKSDVVNAWAVPCALCRAEYAQSHANELLNAIEHLCRPLSKTLDAAGLRLYEMRRGLNYLYDTAALLRNTIEERERLRRETERLGQDEYDRAKAKLREKSPAKPTVVYLLSDGEFLKIGKIRRPSGTSALQAFKLQMPDRYEYCT